MKKFASAFAWFLMVMALPQFFGFQYELGIFLGGLVFLALMAGVISFFAEEFKEIEYKRFYGGEL